MSTLLRPDFNTELATSVVNEIQYQRTNYYYFLGKIESWGVPDFSPENMELDTDIENTLIRSNMIYIKKITANDISLVIPKIDWVSGTIFSIYDNTKNLLGLSYYCITDNNEVYKCLDNNGGVPSTIKPVGKSFFVFKTLDGYTWKYMYSVPSFKMRRFSSIGFIPVQKALTDSFYSKGGVSGVTISNPGSGYTDILRTTITVAGATTGAGAVGTVNVGTVGNITTVNLTSGGTGYTKGVKIAFNSSTGSGGTGTAVISGGIITNITIDTPGVGYVAGDTISFLIGGGVVIPSVSITTGSITSVSILNAGAGYTGTPTLTVVCTSGTGKYGNSTAVLNCVAYNGSIVNVPIVDPGINYLADSSTTIVVSGDGANAAFTPVIYNGSIVDVIIENPGVGYSSMTLTVSGNGTLGKLTPILGTSDLVSDQSVVEQTTVVGGIYSIPITVPGINYTPSTIVTVSGDGSGCTAHPVITNGSVTNIVIDTFGSGYTYTNIAITDVNRSSVSGFTDALAYAVIPPVHGHGYDAVSELFGKSLIINTSLRQDTILNTINQDYRQFGILKGPTNITNSSAFTGDSSVLAYNVNFTSSTGLVLDEILLLDNVSFRVVSWIGTSVMLQQLGTRQINPTGQFIAATNNSRTYNSVSVISSPGANKYSGKLLYLSNENPFSFTSDQGIIVKTFLNF